jgi:ABC-2 type transport system permease protein
VAELSAAPNVREQLTAIARVRWQLFVNSLRTLRGRLELVSHIFITLGFAMGGIGGVVVSGGAAWYLISHGKAEWLAAILWPIFLFWQLFPVVATAFTENFDTSNLLRFPTSYSSFVLIRIAYGSLEPATMLGSLWLLGVAAGTGIASPHLFFWSVLVLLLFAVMNILLARMIFSWVERWLAQRRIREILGVLFLLFIISFQLIGPLMNRYGNREHPQILQLAQWILPLQRFLPPGSAASSIAGAADADFTVAAEGFGILSAYCLAIFWLLNMRLRAQFRGENLSEAPAPAELSGERGTTRVGWSLPGVSGSVAAIFEKEIHYLSRSGPMLFTLIMPVFMLFIFRLTPSTYARGSGSLLGRSSDMAFPMGAAYALLILTNLVYNNFGAEGAGVQLYFTAPVPIRSVMLAKNLAHSSILALEMTFVWIGASLMYGPPALATTVAAAAGILFALPVNLIVGNLLSISSPKKIDFGTFGRQRASNTTVFASFGVQIVVVGLAAITLITARSFGRIWLATIAFLVLATIAWVAYLAVLDGIGQMAFDHREEMIAELTRAS